MRFAFSIRFSCRATAKLAGPMRAFGNAFRLRPVTKNRLSRGIRIAYIAIHFDTFVACPDWLSRRVDIADTPDKQ
ncbi:hypothetical protein BURCENBC7_AP0463 [Burkholderia cenocepacia BC7]|nr:hypothetical protein BURCENK562V_C3658 [Burkholderia cenocepacia K56-2Valvano]ERI29076.1 hypothetical protein BURCENBC7_AP0463 [Burkholderia cenocepacia BC7]